MLQRKYSWVAVLLTAPISSCGLLRTVTEVPEKVASTVSGHEKPAPKTDAAVVSAQLMRFADIAASSVRQAADEYAANATERAERERALQWKIDYCEKLWKLATSPQPYQGLFDTIVLVGSARRVHEQHFGDGDQALQIAFTKVEEGAWELAAECLTKEQLATARSVIDEWLTEHAASGPGYVAHLPRFDDLMKESDGERGALGNLTDLFSLDPLADLEPAVREVAQARQLSERAMYYVQRMPELLSARVELTTQHVMREPELASTIQSFDRVSRAADSLAATAAKLPTELSSQLEASRAPVNDILSNAQRTLEAGDALSKSLTETLRTFDALVARMQTDDAAPAATAPEEPASKPFDVLDYATAADKLTVLARELNTTAAAIDERMPALQRAVDEVAAKGERTIDHAFVRAIELVLIALAAGALTVLLVRRVSTRGRAA